MPPKKAAAKGAKPAKNGTEKQKVGFTSAVFYVVGYIACACENVDGCRRIKRPRRIISWQVLEDKTFGLKNKNKSKVGCYLFCVCN